MARGSETPDEATTAAQEPDILMVRKVLRSILLSSKDGFSMSALSAEYRLYEGDDVPYRAFGYYRLDEFLASMADVARFDCNRFGQPVVFGVPDESTMHIDKLVRAQRGPSKPFPRFSGSSRYSGGPPYVRPGNGRPQQQQQQPPVYGNALMSSPPPGASPQYVSYPIAHRYNGVFDTGYPNRMFPNQYPMYARQPFQPFDHYYSNTAWQVPAPPWHMLRPPAPNHMALAPPPPHLHPQLPLPIPAANAFQPFGEMDINAAAGRLIGGVMPPPVLPAEPVVAPVGAASGYRPPMTVDTAYYDDDGYIEIISHKMGQGAFSTQHFGILPFRMSDLAEPLAFDRLKPGYTATVKVRKLTGGESVKEGVDGTDSNRGSMFELHEMRLLTKPDEAVVGKGTICWVKGRAATIECYANLCSNSSKQTPGFRIDGVGAEDTTQSSDLVDAKGDCCKTLKVPFKVFVPISRFSFGISNPIDAPATFERSLVGREVHFEAVRNLPRFSDAAEITAVWAHFVEDCVKLDAKGDQLSSEPYTPGMFDSDSGLILPQTSVFSQNADSYADVFASDLNCELAESKSHFAVVSEGSMSKASKNTITVPSTDLSANPVATRMTNNIPRTQLAALVRDRARNLDASVYIEATRGHLTKPAPSSSTVVMLDKAKKIDQVVSKFKSKSKQAVSMYSRRHSSGSDSEILPAAAAQSTAPYDFFHEETDSESDEDPQGPRLPLAALDRSIKPTFMTLDMNAVAFLGGERSIGVQTDEMKPASAGTAPDDLGAKWILKLMNKNIMKDKSLRSQFENIDGELCSLTDEMTINLAQ